VDLAQGPSGLSCRRKKDFRPARKPLPLEQSRFLEEFSKSFLEEFSKREKALNSSLERQDESEEESCRTRVRLLVLKVKERVIMQNPFFKHAALAGALAGLSLSLLHVSPALAADPKLDQAAASVTRALTFLQGAQSPDPKKETGGHRKKAIAILKLALAQIQKAKEVANGTARAEVAKAESPKPAANAPKKPDHKHH
jgi:hypothetical protein